MHRSNADKGGTRPNQREFTVERSFNTVAVLGIGKVGELVADLLMRSGFSVVGYDSRPRADLGFAVKQLDVTDSHRLREALGTADAVLTCLPYQHNIAVAEAARQVGVHYFDLTEDVPTTNRVRDLAQDSTAIFAPQCGLAPGLIGIIGASMAAVFEEIRSIELKVGALPQNPTGLLGYAFNWSSLGVVNEYLNDCEVVRGGRRQMVPAMTAKERVVIGGVEFEAALTSGGLGTMCQTYEGRVQRLDYKTLRYPGHFKQMQFLFDELHLRDRRELADEILVNAKPPVNDDVVHLHAAVEGVREGTLQRLNDVRAFRPIEIGGRTWRAISWITSASAVSMVELAATGRLPNTGFIRQEDIALSDLVDTQAGSLITTHGTTSCGKDLS
ncbi:saccharopine dehydrogenase C-terminal domain-containing protein [Pseudactinotalea sp. Z1748]|uniref:saccharopine dehydrogenase family protein n=1 Tax=Pseudactinotalea sp. Z1748 TaxID=3413027 RepID=UPI003C7BD5B5